MPEEFTSSEPIQTRQAPDLTLKLYSLINKVAFSIRKKRRFSRSNYKEKAAWELHHLGNTIQLKLEELRNKYAVRFENTLDRGNSLENYHLLAILDQLSSQWLWRPTHKIHVDVGSKNFYYASCLAAFFNPQQLTGIELDAFGLYTNFHTRQSYAQYYIKKIKQARFLAEDFCKYPDKADTLTFFYPFVIPEPLVRWDLPLSEFKPDTLFKKAFQVLNDDGQLLMINQGDEEYQAAKIILSANGFVKMKSYHLKETLLARQLTPIASLWKKQQNTHEVIPNAHT